MASTYKVDDTLPVNFWDPEFHQFNKDRVRAFGSLKVRSIFTKVRWFVLDAWTGILYKANHPVPGWHGHAPQEWERDPAKAEAAAAAARAAFEAGWLKPWCIVPGAAVRLIETKHLRYELEVAPARSLGMNIVRRLTCDAVDQLALWRDALSSVAAAGFANGAGWVGVDAAYKPAGVEHSIFQSRAVSRHPSSRSLASPRASAQSSSSPMPVQGAHGEAQPSSSPTSGMTEPRAQTPGGSASRPATQQAAPARPAPVTREDQQLRQRALRLVMTGNDVRGLHSLLSVRRLAAGGSSASVADVSDWNIQHRHSALTDGYDVVPRIDKVVPGGTAAALRSAAAEPGQSATAEPPSQAMEPRMSLPARVATCEHLTVYGTPDHLLLLGRVHPADPLCPRASPETYWRALLLKRPPPAPEHLPHARPMGPARHSRGTRLQESVNEVEDDSDLESQATPAGAVAPAGGQSELASLVLWAREDVGLALTAAKAAVQQLAAGRGAQLPRWLNRHAQQLGPGTMPRLHTTMPARARHQRGATLDAVGLLDDMNASDAVLPGTPRAASVPDSAASPSLASAAGHAGSRRSGLGSATAPGLQELHSTLPSSLDDSSSDEEHNRNIGVWQAGQWLQCHAAACLGVVRFTSTWYLVLLRRRVQVGSIGQHAVYMGRSLRLVPLQWTSRISSGRSWLNSLQDKLASLLPGVTQHASMTESRYTGLFMSCDVHHALYWSHTYDLTSHLQSQATWKPGRADPISPARPGVSPVSMFSPGALPGIAADHAVPVLDTQANPVHDPAAVVGVPSSPLLGGDALGVTWRHGFDWSLGLSLPLRRALPLRPDGGGSSWLPPVMHGYFGQRWVKLPAATVGITVLARRSRYFAGTRYLKRGASPFGAVANDVEVEQLVSAPSGRWSSFVQVRGSVPTAWTQRTALTSPKPPIQTQPFDPTHVRAAAHFRDLRNRFGGPTCVLNLVRKAERIPRELHLSRGFVRAVRSVNASLPPEQRAQYLALDYSAISKRVKGRPWNILTAMHDAGAWAMLNTGLFVSHPMPLLVEAAQASRAVLAEHNAAMPGSAALGGARLAPLRLADAVAPVNKAAFQWARSRAPRRAGAGSSSSSRMLNDVAGNDVRFQNVEHVRSEDAADASAMARCVVCAPWSWQRWQEHAASHERHGAVLPVSVLLPHAGLACRLRLWQTVASAQGVGHIRQLTAEFRAAVGANPERVPSVSPEEEYMYVDLTPRQHVVHEPLATGQIHRWMQQRGVLRTNCVDCLDRTNVAQAMAGLHALAVGLQGLGILELAWLGTVRSLQQGRGRAKAPVPGVDQAQYVTAWLAGEVPPGVQAQDEPRIAPSSALGSVLLSLYEAMGDALALQYGGSEAHKKVTAQSGVYAPRATTKSRAPERKRQLAPGKLPADASLPDGQRPSLRQASASTAQSTPAYGPRSLSVALPLASPSTMGADSDSSSSTSDGEAPPTGPARRRASVVTAAAATAPSAARIRTQLRMQPMPADGRSPVQPGQQSVLVVPHFCHALLVRCGGTPRLPHPASFMLFTALSVLPNFGVCSPHAVVEAALQARAAMLKQAVYNAGMLAKLGWLAPVAELATLPHGSSVYAAQTGGASSGVAELVTSLRRYYANSFLDSLRQDGMNLWLTAVKVPGVLASTRAHVWELESDWALHSPASAAFPQAHAVLELSLGRQPLFSATGHVVSATMVTKPHTEWWRSLNVPPSSFDAGCDLAAYDPPSLLVRGHAALRTLRFGTLPAFGASGRSWVSPAVVFALQHTPRTLSAEQLASSELPRAHALPAVCHWKLQLPVTPDALRNRSRSLPQAAHLLAAPALPGSPRAHAISCWSGPWDPVGSLAPDLILDVHRAIPRMPKAGAAWDDDLLPMEQVMDLSGTHWHYAGSGAHVSELAALVWKGRPDGWLRSLPGQARAAMRNRRGAMLARAREVGKFRRYARTMRAEQLDHARVDVRYSGTARAGTAALSDSTCVWLKSRPSRVTCVAKQAGLPAPVPAAWWASTIQQAAPRPAVPGVDRAYTREHVRGLQQAWHTEVRPVQAAQQAWADVPAASKRKYAAYCGLSVGLQFVGMDPLAAVLNEDAQSVKLYQKAHAVGLRTSSQHV